MGKIGYAKIGETIDVVLSHNSARAYPGTLPQGRMGTKGVAWKNPPARQSRIGGLE